MHALEAAAAEAGVSVDTLMASAGLAVAQEVWMLLGQLDERRIVVLVGPGNNGGDGLVAARHLAEWGAAVRCYALTPRDDPQWQATLEAGIPCGSVAEDDDFAALDALFADAEVVVDGLLGTGKARPITGDLAEILRRLQRARSGPGGPKLIAVDLPTGLDADSGRLDPLAVAVDLTVTFQFPKTGLYIQPGAGAGGDVQVVDIGIPAPLGESLPLALLDRRDARALLPPRPADAHKGTFGRLLVVAGSRRYPGAAVLAARAAYRVGAGLVTLATPESLVPAVAGAMPEVTYLPLPDAGAPGVIGRAALAELRGEMHDYEALVLGCGLGRHPETEALVRTLVQDESLRSLRGVVVDADGLNALAGAGSGWADALATPCVLTPHPGEMARLRGVDAAAVQAARLEVAQAASDAWGATVVLKGANTVVAGPDGQARLSAVANAGLATAGVGDVLAGAIGGLLAQGLAPFDAACLGVFLHGDAGERAARARGKAGMTAPDLLDQLALAGRALSGEQPIELDMPLGARGGPGPSLEPGPLAGLAGPAGGAVGPR